MTIFQMSQKMDRIQRSMYKEIAKGNFDKADKLRKQYVDLSVKCLAVVHTVDVFGIKVKHVG